MQLPPIPVLFSLTLLLSTFACTSGRAPSSDRPTTTIRLPDLLKEASGLAIDGHRMYWHNDSGDGPFLYQTDLTGRIVRVDTLAAPAVDYEDMTRDPAGNFYLGDFGNNRGKRTRLAIYRYNATSGLTDTISFTYPHQDGGGHGRPGNHNCEAMVYAGGHLHLFTKDGIGRRSGYQTYHYRVPATPGRYEARLVDSLYLRGRVVTAAALDTVRRQLVLTAYNFNRVLGFLPNGAASVITISDYPDDRFLAGSVHRETLSWGVPTQFEAIDFYDNEWLYVASEATAIRPRAVAKLRRRQPTTTQSAEGRPGTKGVH